MKIKVLKNILLPVSSIIGKRRKVIGEIIEIKDRLAEHQVWIDKKIKEGFFEEVKKVETIKEELPAVDEDLKEYVEKGSKKKSKRKK